MNNTIWIFLITGLTAGGLSCLVVQGGLLSSAIAHEVEKDLITAQGVSSHKKTGRSKTLPPRPPTRIAQPILLFLAAKLVAYTLLGFLLGLLGQVLYLSSLTRGILQLGIGIFMIGNGLRMLNVHPIFRYFNFQPPSQITRYIRRKSKGQDSLLAPLLLGALTVFIPCGVTQSMMALAMGLGSPFMGAATMFAFVLGSMPMFFGATYLATKLSSLAEKYFLRIVAVVLIVLGLVTTNTGLNLVGSPLSFSSFLGLASPSTQNASSVPPDWGSNELIVNVENNGYFPSTNYAPAGQTIQAHFVTQNTQSCSRALVIPALRFEQILPLSGDTVVTIPPQPKDSILYFTCSMGMYSGTIQFN